MNDPARCTVQKIRKSFAWNNNKCEWIFVLDVEFIYTLFWLLSNRLKRDICVSAWCRLRIRLASAIKHPWKIKCHRSLFHEISMQCDFYMHRKCVCKLLFTQQTFICSFYFISFYFSFIVLWSLSFSFCLSLCFASRK